MRGREDIASAEMEAPARYRAGAWFFGISLYRKPGRLSQEPAQKDLW